VRQLKSKAGKLIIDSKSFLKFEDNFCPLKKETLYSVKA
jgi:hypothetical protein